MRNYTTTQGDTWDMIAYRVYGDEKQMSVLMEANSAYMDTVFFSANIVLNVPDIATPVSSSLPPWKRGNP